MYRRAFGHVDPAAQWYRAIRQAHVVCSMQLTMQDIPLRQIILVMLQFGIYLGKRSVATRRPSDPWILRERKINRTKRVLWLDQGCFRIGRVQNLLKTPVSQMINQNPRQHEAACSGRHANSRTILPVQLLFYREHRRPNHSDNSFSRVREYIQYLAFLIPITQRHLLGRR